LRGAASVSPLGLLATVKGLTWTGSGATLGPLGLFFFKAGALTFGSGLAIVPFLHQGLVLGAEMGSLFAELVSLDILEVRAKG
jgi:hypothetical protein